jgi:hypothetical protein
MRRRCPTCPPTKPTFRTARGTLGRRALKSYPRPILQLDGGRLSTVDNQHVCTFVAAAGPVTRRDRAGGVHDRVRGVEPLYQQ